MRKNRVIHEKKLIGKRRSFEKSFLAALLNSTPEPCDWAGKSELQIGFRKSTFEFFC